MTRFWVLEPAGAAAPSEGARAVADRFRRAALPLPFLWLAAHRAWIAALAALAADGLLLAMALQPGLGEPAFWLAALLRIGIALEGPRIVAHSLRRRGWQDVEIFHARDHEALDRLYFGSGPEAETEPERPEPPAVKATSVAPAPAPAQPIFGWRRARHLLETEPRS